MFCHFRPSANRVNWVCVYMLCLDDFVARVFHVRLDLVLEVYDGSVITYWCALITSGKFLVRVLFNYN